MALVAIFVAVALIPGKTYASSQIPGKYIGPGKYGPTCACPWWPDFNCGCLMVDEQ
jgi:hypothetical protein